MLKKSLPKNARIILNGLLVLVCLAAIIFYPYINTNLILNVFPFLSPAANVKSLLYGENIDMSQILPGSQHYVINRKGEDLIDIAADLGVNLVRITNAERSFNNDADSIYAKDQWDQVLNKMQRKGIKALILIEVVSSNSDYYNPQIQPVYLHLVQEYIDSGVFANPDVYAVDIKNEPVLTDANLRMLQKAHDMIKAKYPNLKQTVGWWATSTTATDPYNPQDYKWSDYAAGKKLANMVDFYSIHMYNLADDVLGLGLNPDLKTKVFLSQVEHGLRTKKPILIEEFGEANGDAVSDQATIGSPQLQANVYQGVYQALKEMHNSQLIGTAGFDFYSRNQYPDAWAIVKDNGNYLFPAAYILQEYASGKKNPALGSATVVTSQSYLATNTDNHTIKNLHVSDRIGLDLQLDDSKNYTFSVSVNGRLQPVETFLYDPDSDSYQAVYRAISKGNVQLNITTSSDCKTSVICNVPVYTLTINIQ
jgi:hypothetical protein